MRTISLEELRERLDRGRVTLVEVLSPAMYEQAHIPGAINLPPNEVHGRAAEVLPDRNAEIVTYCGGGG